MQETAQIPLIDRPYSKELIIQTSKSSGPGGQHVNKTETKVELRFHVDNSDILSPEEKELVKEKLKNRINNDGYLIVTAQEHRSQIKNKELAEKIFTDLLTSALKKRRKRIATKPSGKIKEQRLQSKKIVSEKKIRRTKPKLENGM